jgi:quinoprotein glucose dehydrogenase
LILNCLAYALLVLVVVGQATSAQSSTKSVVDGVYTEEQARRGDAVSKANCMSCHGDRLTGDMGPALAGAEFLGNWDGETAAVLFEKIKTTMPQGSEGSLTARQTADVMAYLFQLNKFPAGQTELSTDAGELGAIKIEKPK